MVKLTEIHASFEKRVSDNNYGGECSRIDLIAQLDEGDDPIECVALLMVQARHRVHMDLAQSLSGGVRRAVDMPKPTPEVAPDLEELPFDEVSV